MSTFYFAHEMH